MSSQYAHLLKFQLGVSRKRATEKRILFFPMKHAIIHNQPHISQAVWLFSHDWTRVPPHPLREGISPYILVRQELKLGFEATKIKHMT